MITRRRLIAGGIFGGAAAASLRWGVDSRRLDGRPNW